MKKKDNYKILIIICIILLCVTALLFFDNEKEVELVEKEPRYILVNDYSIFFTINSCVHKYITLLSGKKTNELLQVMDDNYINTNNLNKKNIYKYVKKLEGTHSFITKKIYYEEEKENEYYVYGFLQKESIDGLIKKEDYYVIINLDTKNNLYSVTPYNGKIFKEGK